MVITKMESVNPDRIPWEKQYYGDIIIPCYPKSIKCKLCGTAYIDEITEISHHIAHLNIEHYKTELTDHPEREFFIQKFFINEEKSKAKCRTCKEVIKYNKYGLYLLKNHVEIYHGSKSYIYKLMTTRIEPNILDKYFIIGSEATCPKCELKMDMTDLNIYIVEKVEVLLDHYFSHSSEYIHQNFKEEELKKLKRKIIFEKIKQSRLKRQQENIKKRDERLRRKAYILKLSEIAENRRTDLNK